MSDERPLRDEVERLSDALRQAVQRVAEAETARAQQLRGDATRLAALRTQHAALGSQLARLQRERAAQLAQLREVEAALARARDSVPQHASSGGGSDGSWVLRMIFEPTPAWARDRSLLGRLFARWVNATGRAWK